MVTLVNKPQSIRVGVKHPNPGYSRVISCFVAPKGLAAIDYDYTIIVGQTVRLLSVRLFFLAQDPDVTKQVSFKVVTGTSAPKSAAELYTWDSVIPMSWKGTGDHRWYHYVGRADYVWTMNRLYEGAGRRFGIWAQCNWLGLDVIYASFEVSEG